MSVCSIVLQAGECNFTVLRDGECSFTVLGVSADLLCYKDGECSFTILGGE